MATYNLNKFMDDCGYGLKKTYVIRGAMDTARTDFNLKTQSEVLKFINKGGLESPSFINSKKWENNPQPKKLIMVDSYRFYSGNIFGYIAFFFQPATKQWVIKSLKENREPDPRNFALKQPLVNLMYNLRDNYE